MRTKPRASETLLGAIREIVVQSEQVAKAETRVAASRLSDVARSGVRRTILMASAALAASFAIGYVLYAVLLVLVRFTQPWIASLIIAGVLALAAGLLGWAGLSGATRAAAAPQSHRTDLEVAQ